MWDERYSSKNYAYGTEANDFLKEMIDKLPQGKVLCLAEGEGRNSVWLAQFGYEVTAVDASKVGLSKAKQLAQEKNVSITTVHADLADFEIGKNKWNVIVSIFCHLPSELRKQVHQRCIDGLRTGGVMLIEAYTPQQLEFKTGGPPTADMMMTSVRLKEELKGLDFIYIKECVRDIYEGEFHTGAGAVVQALAVKS